VKKIGKIYQGTVAIRSSTEVLFLAKGLEIFVTFLVLANSASVAIAQAGRGKLKIVLLANDIDYELAQDFFGFLGNKGGR
jgi:DeoR/GlpR family transcriptional regulator of sugar metabolism